MKLQTLATRITPLLARLRCPQCGAPLALFENRSLVCVQRHCFDLSTKGYINLAPGHNQSAEKYDAALFESRSRVFADGFYAHVAQALQTVMERHMATMNHNPDAGEPPAPSVRLTGSSSAPSPADQAIPLHESNLPQSFAPLVVDVGCGEGYYARVLAESATHPAVVGVDLSRDAILAAARQAPTLHWFVADLTRLPFADHSADVLLDVLTPADYREFARVLKPDGLLLKVIPADDYLCEIRQAVAEQLHSSEFSNARVQEHLRANAQVVEQLSVRRTLPVTPAQAQAFLRMTPMTFGLTDAQREAIAFETITVAMEVCVCKLPPA